MSKKKVVAAPVAVEVEPVETVVTVGQKMAATLRKHRVKYVKVQSSSGNASLDNGDPTAVLLRSLAPEAVIALAQRVLKAPAGETIPNLAEKYEKLNPGQKRMNAGNLIRNAIKRGELTHKDVEKALKA